MRAERVDPAPKGKQINLSVFNGEPFVIEGVRIKLAFVPMNLADLIFPAIG